MTGPRSGQDEVGLTTYIYLSRDFSANVLLLMLPLFPCKRFTTINPLLTKLVRSRWQDIGQVLFVCVWSETKSIDKAQNNKRTLSITQYLLVKYLEFSQKRRRNFKNFNLALHNPLNYRPG